MSAITFANTPTCSIDDQIAFWNNLRDNYMQALANDALNPQMDYSFEGQSVSRDQWRSMTIKACQTCNEILATLDLTEITTVQM